MNQQEEDALIAKIEDECWDPLKPSIETAIRLAIRAAVAHERERAAKEGYLLGFNASGEGWNGEYPFGDNGIPPENDPGWIEKRDEIVDAAIRRGE